MNKFPECVYLGEFSSQEYSNLPAYLPANQGGFCINYQVDNATAINRQVENTVLCLLEDTPVNLLQIRIFDFANRPNFPFLNELKNQGLCQVALNEHATQNTFNKLESIIQHRYYNLFNINSGENHLDQYNARSPRPEPYFVLIINTACFPNNSLSAQRLQNFINSAYGAGIYIIALHDPSQFDPNNNNPALNSLLQALPSVQINQNQLKIAEDILPVQKMAQFDFQFTPADINQNQIIKQLQEQLQGDTNSDESDFLNVKIGTQPNGEDAYLTLGEKSKCFHAMLLGVTGSGKSVLLNNIIMQIGKKYHAKQILLHLMDYKKGIEFKHFKNHPNVEKLFYNDENQTGIEVLEQLKITVGERNSLLSDYGYKEISKYNADNPNEPLPFIMLIIDEFHNLFKGDWRHQQYVDSLIEDIAKLGRSAGVHLLFCTQDLKGIGDFQKGKGQFRLRMTYAVEEISDLGHEFFDGRYHKTILDLNTYQIFAQIKRKQNFTAFIDKPLEIEKTIKKLRLTRPSYLQVRTEIVQSVQNEEKQADKPKQATSSAENKTTADYDNPLLNPNAKQDIDYTYGDKFADMGNTLAELEKKLSQQNGDDNNDDNDYMDFDF